MKRITICLLAILMLAGCSRPVTYDITMKDGRQFRVQADSIAFTGLNCLHLYNSNSDRTVFKACAVEKYEMYEIIPEDEIIPEEITPEAKR